MGPESYNCLQLMGNQINLLGPRGGGGGGGGAERAAAMMCSYVFCRSAYEMSRSC